MDKVLLTERNLVELDDILLELYAFFRQMRARYSVAKFIHYPSIPSILSESLVVHCVEFLFGSAWAGKLGKNVCDVILERPSEQRTVEVKASGQTGFQEFKAKDLDADFLVWVDFGERYTEGSDKLSIYVLKNPGRHFDRPLRLKLHQFLSRTQGDPDLKCFETQSLQNLLNS